MKSGHRSSHQRIDPRCRRSGVAAGPGRIDSHPREGGAGGHAAPALRSGGGRLHLKVCCFVGAALMCNRKNKDEAFGPTEERESAPDAPVSPPNRRVCVNKRLFLF